LPVRVDVSLRRFRRSRLLLGLRLLALALWHMPAAARAEQPMLAPDALHGGRYVGSARPPGESARIAGTFGYGYTEGVLPGGEDRHHRVAWELYAAWLDWPALQISLGTELRYDTHLAAGARTDQGFLGSTRITTRHALEVLPGLSLAAQPSVLVPGASSPRRGLSAATVELSGLASYELDTGTLFGLSLGYRFDRTREAVAAPFALSPPDRLAASIAANDACVVGSMVSFPLQTARALVEFSWDVPAGARDLRPSDSPMHLRAALQSPPLAGRITPSVEFGVDASTRPVFDRLVRIEPRLWARLGVNVRLGPQPRSAAAAPKQPSAAVASGPPGFMLSVTGEWGEPIIGARVLSADGAQEHITDGAGQVLLQLEAGPNQLRVEAEGYAPVQRIIDPSDPDAHTLMLSVRMPRGEIKGTVRSLSGESLRARVTVLPLGLVAQSDALGQFSIDVPPGIYTVRIAADGFETQDRAAEVELRGVTILLIDLRADAHEAQRGPSRAGP
jgi:hypothetical protein